MTWGDSPEVVATIRSIMLDSRETFVHYTMPLGLHHLIGGNHYAPMPENTDPRRADWSATTITARTRPASATIGRATAATAWISTARRCASGGTTPRPRPTSCSYGFITCRGTTA